jgi:hypothetical protein
MKRPSACEFDFIQNHTYPWLDKYTQKEVSRLCQLLGKQKMAELVEDGPIRIEVQEQTEDSYMMD